MSSWTDPTKDLGRTIREAREAVAKATGQLPNQMYLPKTLTMAECREMVAKLRVSSPELFANGLKVFRGWDEPVEAPR